TFATLNLNSNYRVLSFGNPFNETNTSYFHKSIGGYHGAKLKRYQEVIEHRISAEMEMLQSEQKMISEQKNIDFQELQPTLPPNSNFQAIFDTLPIALPEKYVVLNMLNTRYLSFNPNSVAFKNKGANGNAWFVGQIKKVDNANDEMNILGKLNSKKEAVLNIKDFADFGNVLSTTYAVDSSCTVQMTSYDVNSITYQSNSKVEVPAIFSEIYYPEGWNCYIDGEKTDKVFRANYILRGALIPAGKHKIEWKFEPESFSSGSDISKFGSISLFLLILGSFLIVIFKSIKSQKIS
ncbi:MAG: hypothetical protein ACKO6J_09220, partial [Crocinitomicaceae bacterium]